VQHRLRVFENRALRKIFGPKRDEITGEGGWRRPYNVDLYDVHSSPNIIWVIKSRIMQLSGYLACTGEKREV
jgi:hypothetical protein